LREVIESALATGAPEPVWIAVDDADRQWKPLAAACPLSERARGIVVAADDRALVTAHRLGIGGAAARPVSTPALADAMRSASAGSGPAVSVDPGSIALFEGVDTLGVATFSNRAFWRAQLGERVLSRLLFELAIGLETVPAIVPWPALLLADRDGERVTELWQSLAAGVGRPVEDLVILGVKPGRAGVVASVYSTLLQQAEHIREVKSVSAEPVYELPSGRLLGWWASEPGPQRSGGWVASPERIEGGVCRWRLAGTGSKQVVDEVLEIAELDRLDGAEAVRVPGWLTVNLRPGTPAGLMVQRLADAAARRGLPLWVPNVDTDALRFALRLPGTIWVDGPAVPR
jgi:hypothetical protein